MSHTARLPRPAHIYLQHKNFLEGPITSHPHVLKICTTPIDVESNEIHWQRTHTINNLTTHFLLNFTWFICSIYCNILSLVWVGLQTGFGLWIGFIDSLIQRVTRLYNSVLHTYTHISVYSHVFTSRCSVAAYNGARCPSSGFPNYPRASVTSFSQNKLPTTELQQSFNYQLSDWVTHQPTYTTQLTGWTLTNLLITYWHGRLRKHRSSLTVYGTLSSRFAVVF
jgi:hypothetical protein